jgi:hypothetical protein
MIGGGKKIFLNLHFYVGQKRRPAKPAVPNTTRKTAPKPADLTGFIPSELIVDGRPELAVFPLSIMYSNPGSAVYNLYDPDLSTYKCGEEKCAMAYFSRFKRNWHIIIIRDKKSGHYEGRKYHNGKMVLSAIGGDWNGFFGQLTLFGLSEGEAEIEQ